LTQNKKPDATKPPHEIELPQTIISEFARFLVPEIKKFYESEEGQRAFAEWQAEQVKEK
jgi:hypothetical protein